MKKIIKNKVYDTEKAQKIFSFIRRKQGSTLLTNPGYCFMDRCNCSFYLTDKGNYFEADLTREEIKIVSEYEVKEVVRELDTDRYIELFGEVEEG